MPKSRKRKLKKKQPKRSMPSNQVPRPRPSNEVVSKQTHTQITGKFYQGIIPSPEMMGEYAAVDPTFPDRIMRMAEDEGKHRRKIEKSFLNKGFILDTLGLIFGLVSVLGVACIGYLFMKHGNAAEGKWIICTVMVSLGLLFVTRGKRAKAGKS